MSTTSAKFAFYILAALSCLFSGVRAGEIKIRVRIDAASSSTVFVSGEIAGAANRNWSFANSIAGAENLGERITDFDLRGRDNQKIAFKKLIAGEYLASGAAEFFSYKINLNESQNQNAAAHVSWLKDGRGILMLNDLLPRLSSGEKREISALVEFDLPKDWKIVAREAKAGEGIFKVEDVENAVFPVGKNWREMADAEGDLRLAISGDWLFSDDEARQTAREIYGEYAKIFGESAGGKIQISLAHFPQSNVQPGRWTAETRGANLTIVSSDMPFKTQSLQRLHEQLRHELFHLWMPNRLALTGSYDWFYEGFAIYESLKLGVRLNRIRFEDFLDTLAQSYDLQTEKISLIEASKNRWGANQIYARGMLAAFLVDLALLRESKGRRSVENLLQEIYRKHRQPNEARDGSAAILEIFKNYKELNAVVEKYVKGAEKIDWQTDLDAIGVEASRENGFTHLKIKTKLTNRQKDLLNELGYNNWRKISGKQK